MYLLDTNVISELRRGSKAHPAVLAWAQTVLPEYFFLSAITILEIQRGILLVARRDAVQGALLGQWLDHVILPEFRERILPFDTETALRCAALHVPDPKPERDALIAARALAKDLTLVTRNLRDFSGCALRLLDPWAVQPR